MQITNRTGRVHLLSSIHADLQPMFLLQTRLLMATSLTPYCQLHHTQFTIKLLYTYYMHVIKQNSSQINVSAAWLTELPRGHIQNPSWASICSSWTAFLISHIFYSIFTNKLVNSIINWASLLAAVEAVCHCWMCDAKFMYIPIEKMESLWSSQVVLNSSQLELIVLYDAV